MTVNCEEGRVTTPGGTPQQTSCILISDPFYCIELSKMLQGSLVAASSARHGQNAPWESLSHPSHEHSFCEVSLVMRMS